MTLLSSEYSKADVVLINGKVVTVDFRNSIKEGVAIKFGRIIAAGPSHEIKELAGKSTDIIDLRGKTVLPGIIDSHTHPCEAAARFLEIDCRAPEIRRIKDIQAAIARRVKQTIQGTWIRVSNFNDSKVVEKKQITRWQLDAVSPDHPVYVQSDTGHQGIANSLALNIAGIDKNTPDPAGGAIDRDASGEATGLLYETASQLVGAKIPAYTLTQIKEGLKQVFRQFSRWGITSTHDASAAPTGIRAYQELLSEGFNKVRVNLMVRHDAGPEVALENMKSLGIESGFGNDWLRVMTLKIWGDGSGAGGTSAVYYPQHRGPKGIGLWTTAPEDMERIVMKAHEAGIRVSIHSIGDRGIDAALDCFEKAQKKKPVKDMRHRIEHNSCCTPKQLRRIKELGVTPSSSIGYMYSLGDQYAENFGTERSRWLHPHKTMLEMGIIAGGNNDCPITYYGPFVQIYTAVTRKTVTGQIISPEEAINVTDAIRVYTWNGAYLAKEEDTKGSIEPGKLADMIVLDRDIQSIPAEEIKNTEVVTTVVNGKIVYQKE